MKKVTVFCGASSGFDPIYHSQAIYVGQVLVKNNIELIYGGGKIGIMGAVADGVLSAGGKAIGVIPKFLSGKEIAHEGLTELILVETMHERKAKMNELCDGIIALPGGYGTLEELFEMLTWAQLGLHRKPIGLLNTDGYYDSLIALIRDMVDRGFLKEINQQMLLVSDDIEDLLAQMSSYVAPDVPKWISEETT
jgi:uncharacterized protein (TIGR00730 family)